MRRSRAVVVLLASWSLLATSVRAAPALYLKVALDPDRLGARTTIKLALRVSGEHNGPPETVRSLGLGLPVNMGIAGSTLGEANCYPSRLLTQGLVGCSPNARVGFGSATAIVPVESRTILEHANVEALMGEPAEDRIEILFYVEAESPVAGALVLPSVVREASAPYGEELATTVPAVEVWPGGPDLALETFDSTLGPLGLTYHRRVGGHMIAYKPRGIRIPRACPSRGFPFRAQVTFADGAHESAVYHVPCPPR